MQPVQLNMAALVIHVKREMLPNVETHLPPPFAGSLGPSQGRCFLAQRQMVFSSHCDTAWLPLPPLLHAASAACPFSLATEPAGPGCQLRFPPGDTVFHCGQLVLQDWGGVATACARSRLSACR